MLLVAVVEELLDHVVAKHVLHELEGVGDEFLEDLFLLIAVGGLQLGLDESRTELVPAENSRMFVDVRQFPSLHVLGGVVLELLENRVWWGARWSPMLLRVRVHKLLLDGSWRPLAELWLQVQLLHEMSQLRRRLLPRLLREVDGRRHVAREMLVHGVQPLPLHRQSVLAERLHHLQLVVRSQKLIHRTLPRGRRRSLGRSLCSKLLCLGGLFLSKPCLCPRQRQLMLSLRGGPLGFPGWLNAGLVIPDIPGAL